MFVLDENHQDEPTAINNLLIDESTDPSDIQHSRLLMIVNEDCLRLILAHVTAVDLCSLRELSEILNDASLRVIIDDTFRRKYKVCDLNQITHTMDEAQRLLTNFGPLISDLTVTEKYSDECGARIIKLIVQRCSGTLKSLDLRNFYLDKSEPAAVFAELQKLSINVCDSRFATDQHSESSYVLAVHPHRIELTDAMIQHTYPKLESFCGQWEIKTWHRHSSDSERCRNFFLRHKNLKTIILTEPDDISVLPVIAANCSQLRKFHFSAFYTGDSIIYRDAVKRFTSLKRLEEVTITGDLLAVFFIQQLCHSRSLKRLSLNRLRCTPKIISAVTQLKMLEKLHIQETEVFINCDAFAELPRLKELSVVSYEDADFDLPYMVGRLADLKKLNLRRIDDFKIDGRMYAEIDNARSKAGSAHRTLRIVCNGIKTVFPGRIV
jgi:hypothetical protein